MALFSPVQLISLIRMMPGGKDARSSEKLFYTPSLVLFEDIRVGQALRVKLCKNHAKSTNQMNIFVNLLEINLVRPVQENMSTKYFQ